MEHESGQLLYTAVFAKEPKEGSSRSHQTTCDSSHSGFTTVHSLKKCLSCEHTAARGIEPNVDDILLTSSIQNLDDFQELVDVSYNSGYLYVDVPPLGSIWLRADGYHRGSSTSERTRHGKGVFF